MSARQHWIDAKIVPVLLAGGIGTRLWPLSRPDLPKQFLPLLGDHSLFQTAALRVADPERFAAPLVVCNAGLRFVAQEQLRAVGIEPMALLVEPEGRNTAPAAALAALYLAAHGDAGYMLLLPADHAIGDAPAFLEAIARGQAAARGGRLVTFGVLPDRPETEYGYIRAGGELADVSGCFDVERFVEKPDRATATGYLADGRYYWNAGIFLAGVRPLLDEMGRHRPDIGAGCAAALNGARHEGGFVWPRAEPFCAIAGESIDYAVMEHTQRAAVVPVDMAWSDVGSWSSLAAVLGNVAGTNVHTGNVHALDVRNSYLRAESRMVAAVGVDNLVVVETPDAVLVASMDRAADVKRMVAQLGAARRPEIAAHIVCHRPWGWFRSMGAGPGFQIKEICVKPGARLSLQRHARRAEQWIVAEGEARITVGARIFPLAAGGHADIPQGTVHRLENTASVALRVVEVQFGAYLGEDDIERLDDDYGRADLDASEAPESRQSGEAS